MPRILTPHHRMKHVWELTPELLRAWGIRALLLDVDCTLTRYRHGEPLPEAARWLDAVRAAGVRVCLVSNGMGARIQQFAERLGLPCVFKALKPFPWGVRAAMRKLGAAPDETAMVGDQLFADIMAGRLAGVRSILVEPIHPEDEPWWTRIKRLPERMLLSKARVNEPLRPSS